VFKIFAPVTIFTLPLATQSFSCLMIPSFIIVPGALWPLLPPGIHEATMDEVFERYATNDCRCILFSGFKHGVENLFNAGCQQVFLDGSYITANPNPGGYIALWDRKFVDPIILDPVFLDFARGTIFQKEKYFGEFFPISATVRGTGMSFMNFFQRDQLTGAPKGIVRVANYLKKGGSI
jgi:hypothetical protein